MLVYGQVGRTEGHLGEGWTSSHNHLWDTPFVFYGGDTRVCPCKGGNICFLWEKHKKVLIC